MTMTSVKRTKIKLREVNKYLVCRLCRGYYVDATTIAECLHSFCRSCIIKYLQTNSFCPVCEVQVHKTKPYLNLRLDKALQDVVYKLVPGLYQNEMARRRNFYGDKPDSVAQTTPERRGVEERLIFSPEDSISLSLEYIDCPDPEPDTVSSHSSENGEDFPLQLGLMKVRRGDSSARKESTDSNEPGNYPKRYLRCPAVISIRVLKKFLTQKFELSSNTEVEIMYKRVPLPEHYTLMDVAYIFTWKRMSPVRLFYQICKIKTERKINEPKIEVSEKPTVLSAEPIKTEPEPVVKTAIPQEAEKKEVAKPAEITVKKQIELTKKQAEIVKPAVENPAPEVPKKPLQAIQPKPVETAKKPVETVKKPVETVKKPVETVKKPVENMKKPEVVKKPGEVGVKRTFEMMKKPMENRVNRAIETIARKLTEKPQEKKVETDKKTEPEVKPAEKVEGPPPPGKHQLPVGIIKRSPEKLVLNPVSGKLEVEKKSAVQQLKTFRKEKNPAKPTALTISTTPSKDKPVSKEEANVSIEIKTDGSKSEYDFESSSPPNRIMSLQEYTQSELYKTKYSKVNGTMNLQDFRKTVLNGGKSEDDGKKDKAKEVPLLYRIPDKKPKAKEEPARVININTPELKQVSPPKTKREADAQADAEILRMLLKRRDAMQKSRQEKRAKTLSPKMSKNEQDAPKDIAKAEPKKDQTMLEMLISVAQKQSIEPLLKVPQFPHGSKSPGQVSQSDINQALQFFQKLSSDMTMLEAKTQAEQTVPPKTPNMLTLQQYYLQQIEFIRMLKRQQALTNDAKLPKSEDGKTKDETALKSVERTLSKIQEQAEIQRRIAVAQNCKNFPPLLQYFNNAILNKTPANGQKLSAEDLLVSQQQIFNAGLTSEMSFHQMFQQYLAQQLKMNQRKPVKRTASPSPRLGSPPEKKPTPPAVTSPKPVEKTEPAAAAATADTTPPAPSPPAATPATVTPPPASTPPSATST